MAKKRTPVKRSTPKQSGKTPPVKRQSVRPPVRPGGAAASARITPAIDIGKVWQEIGVLRPIEFRVTFARPDDLLVCDFIFDNFRLHDHKLVRKNPTAAATLIVELPPQGFGEQAFLDETGKEVQNPIPAKEVFAESAADVNPDHPKNVRSNAEPLGTSLPFAKIRMAGRSRLAFAMPPNEADLPFTLNAILDACRRWPMALDVIAAPEPPPRRVSDDLLTDKAAFNKSWLASVTSSRDWLKAGAALFDLLGAPLEAPITEAASRVAATAAAALNSGRARNLSATLTRTMNAAIDDLAARHPQLREVGARGYALAALSLKSTQAFATSEVREVDLESMVALPFIPIFLSPHQPAPTVTALELPYRIILSPIAPSNWWHALMPVAHNGRTELWHTRLTRTTNGIGVDAETRVRAIWSPDYPLPLNEILDAVNHVPPKPVRMPLDPLDRQMLVKLMAGFNEVDADERTFIPHSSRSRRLALSSLGALLDVDGSWNQLPKDVGLSQWRHLASLGRDHYVRVVYEGALCDCTNRASVIKVTERKFEWLDPANRTNRVAVLRQQFYIVVRQPVVFLNGAGHAFNGRNCPFTKIEILTPVTPSLQAPGMPNTLLLDPDDPNDPQDEIYSAIPNRACFWPMIDANRDFLFQIAVTDLAGERTPIEMPLLFVGVEANPNGDVMAEIIKRYNAAKESRRTASFRGASVCYAPIKAGAEGDPRLPTAEIRFAAGPVTGISKTKPQFYPEVERASVGIAAIQRLLQQPDAMTDVEYPDKYNSVGFKAGPNENPGEVFLKTAAPFSLEFGDGVKSDALGALSTPSMTIQGLSRVMGPVGAQPPSGSQTIEDKLASVIANEFDPDEFFKGATILGGIPLSEILAPVTSLAGADVPKLLSKQLPDRIEARFDWKTNINGHDSLGLFVPNPDGAQTSLEMHGVVSTPIAPPGPAVFNAEATLLNFKVNLFGFIIIWFDRLRFLAKSGQKPDVAVDLHPGDKTIEFGGPLEFVNTLREIIPSNGFSDPPSLAVTPSGISASYSLNIPSVAVGIFALEHVSIGAGFALPFDAKPVEVRFNFCERQRPFSLTVSMLGGGGFFAISIGTEGVREIEAALEFGAALSIDLGVASGSVEIKAGIYFHWKSKSVELAGYVRLHGELSVLGLISASLTFNLQLAFLKESGHSVVWGEATLTVEIEVLFFSGSVSVTCRREFGGSDGDPKFIELVPDQATWAAYCQAFAAEAA